MPVAVKGCVGIWRIGGGKGRCLVFQAVTVDVSWTEEIAPRFAKLWQHKEMCAFVRMIAECMVMLQLVAA